MKGKICVVTGATSGIGRATAIALAREGAMVVVVGRDREKSESTVEYIKTHTGNSNAEYMLADLSSQREVRQLAEQFRNRFKRLDVLINNAGGSFPKRQLSVDGIELTFALNHLSYFLLTNLLLDTMIASAPARIINVSSSGHRRAKMNFDDLQRSVKYNGFDAYCQSKLANIMFTYALARRLEGSGVTVNALHPGLVRTNISRNARGIQRLFWRLITLFAASPEKGSQTSVYLATSPEVEKVTGKYFVKKKAVPSSEESYDEAAQEKLWKVSAELTGLKSS